jgi:hypothetical protein
LLYTFLDQQKSFLFARVVKLTQSIATEELNFVTHSCVLVLNASHTTNREYSEELEEELFHSAGLFEIETVEDLLMHNIFC